jgi:hypothetical protein
MRRLVTIVLISSSAAACATNGGESIIVLKNVVPADGCTFNSSESEAFVTHGTLDLAFDHPYLFAGQMKSRVVLSADPTGTGSTTSDIDAKTIFLRSANIDLAFPNPPFALTGLSPGLTHFKKLFSAVLRPESITDATFELIPADLTKEILAINAAPPNIEVEATFTIIGDMGGNSVSSQPFVFPVTLGNNLTLHNQGTCPLPKGTVVDPGNPCNIAQDGDVDCCTDATTNTLVCPATVSTI